ncbi:hypothetical protein KC460_00735 [Candidatus Dependentiae bacterium]|nr:hypothetical protein [Candidatus Dependentiae bacterium]
MNKNFIFTLVIFLLLPFSGIASDSVIVGDVVSTVSAQPVVVEKNIDDTVPKAEGILGEIVPIERITQERIDINRKKIDRLLFRNKCWRYGLRGATVTTIGGAITYLIWRCYSVQHIDVTDTQKLSELFQQYVPESTQDVFDNKQITQVLFKLKDISIAMSKKITQLKVQIATLNVCLSKLTPTSGLLDWTKYIGGKIRDGLVASVGLIGISRANDYIQKIFANRDLKWFIEAKTTLEETLQELQHAAQQLHTGDISEYQREFYMAMLPRSCNRLVDQLEDIIAFMEYGNYQLPKEVVTAHGLSMMSCYLFSCVNDRCHEIEALLKHMQENSTDTDAPQKIELSIAQLKTEIINTIERYKAAFIIVTKENKG